MRFLVLPVYRIS